MATGIRSWSTTAATNASADSNINFAEGQAPSTLNDSMRYVMKVIADYLAAIGYGIMTGATVGGTANAITLTSPTGTATAARTAGQLYGFKLGANTTSTVALVVDGLASGAIQYKGTALVSGDGTSGDYWIVEDDATNYQLLTPPRVSAPVVDLPTSTTGGATGDLLHLDSSGSGARTTVANVLKAAIASITAKATPVAADNLIIGDSAASNAPKIATFAQLLQSIISLTAKATPVVADTIVLTDSAASNAAKRATLTQLLTAVAAAQSDQETATSVVLPVTPGRQQFHPSAAKAWVTWTLGGTTILASYNVASITRNAAGDYTVTFTTAFSSANYGVSGVVIAPNSTALSFLVVPYTPAAGTCGIQVVNTNSGKSDGAQSCSVTFFGDQ